MIVKSQVAANLNVFFHPGEVMELRVFDDQTFNGYFKDKDLLAKAAEILNAGSNPRSCYFCLNPVIEERYESSTRPEEIAATLRGEGVSNKHVQCCRWLLVDIDTLRESGAESATDQQKEAAKQVGFSIYIWLRDRFGGGCLVVADSGNGMHILVRLNDHPVTAESAWSRKKLLQILAEQFDNEHAKVDKSTYNSARVTALYGTVKRKGQHTKATPHRPSEILQVPDTITAVTWEQLQTAVGNWPGVNRDPSTEPGDCHYDIPAILEERTHDYRVDDQYILDNGETATLYELQICPFNKSHFAKARIIVMPSGAVSFSCFHESCEHNDWAALKQKWKLKAGIGVEDIIFSTPQTSSTSFNSLESYINPPVADPAAFYGPFGEIVTGLEGHTEASPMAMLCCVLAYFGGSMGRKYFVPLDQAHFPKLYIALVGTTASGRKGTADVQARRIIKAINPLWEQFQHNGLSTGEGILQVLQDNSDGIVPRPAVFTEREFAAVLRRADRSGNTLNAYIRDAWDDAVLANSTKKDPIRVVGHHISLLTHITPAELKQLLSNTDVSNGFANRFLWIYSQRAGRLPGVEGFFASNFRSQIAQLKAAVQSMKDRLKGSAQETIQLPFDTAAGKLWKEELYFRLDIDADQDTMLTLMCSRQAQQVCRMALIFAMADGSLTIQIPHLRAACAIADYCWETVDYMLSRDWWGDKGNAHDPAGMAPRVLEALQEYGSLTRTAISVELFQKNRTAREINALRNLLIANKQITVEPEGRSEIWKRV